MIGPENVDFGDSTESTGPQIIIDEKSKVTTKDFSKPSLDLYEISRNPKKIKNRYMFDLPPSDRYIKSIQIFVVPNSGARIKESIDLFIDGNKYDYSFPKTDNKTVSAKGVIAFKIEISDIRRKCRSVKFPNSPLANRLIVIEEKMVNINELSQKSLSPLIPRDKDFYSDVVWGTGMKFSISFENGVIPPSNIAINEEYFDRTIETGIKKDSKKSELEFVKRMLNR